MSYYFLKVNNISTVLFSCFKKHNSVKVRIQLLGQGSKTSVSNPFTVASSIVKAEGARGLYSGLSASLTRQATYGTARIGLHRVFSQKLKVFNGDHGGHIPFWQKAVSGMASGAIAVCVGTPFDVALVRMQNDGSLPAADRRNYRGVGDAIGRIYREEGLQQLWRGLSPNILRGMSMNLGMMACYDQAKQMIVTVTKAPDSLTTQLGAAAAAGFCCAALSLPFDMIKSRLQGMKADPVTGQVPYKVRSRSRRIAVQLAVSTPFFRVDSYMYVITLVCCAAAATRRIYSYHRVSWTVPLKFCATKAQCPSIAVLSRITVAARLTR